MANNILIVGPAWIGDMVMAQSLFITLKKTAAVNITVLAPQWSIGLLNRMPEITKSIIMPVGHGKLQLYTRYILAKQIKQEKYDIAYVLPNSFKSALIPFWAKIPRRIGWIGEWRWRILNEARRLDKAKYPLMVQRFVALATENNVELTTYPYPKLLIDKDCIEVVHQKFKLPILSKPILAICPGAHFGSSKRWPAEYFASIAADKVSAGWDIWLFGSNNDILWAKQIANKLPKNSYINFTGRTTLEETVDLLSLTSIVVSNDSGLMHIAAALAKPLVSIYGSSSPAFTPPLIKQKKIIRNHDLKCSPCFKRNCPLQHHACMQNLKPKQVLSAIESLELECGF